MTTKEKQQEFKKCINCGFVERIKFIFAYGNQFEDPNQKCSKCKSDAYSKLTT